MPIIKINGQMKISTIKEQFVEVCGVEIEVLDNNGERAGDSLSVAKIRDKKPRKSEIKIVGQARVATVEKVVHDNFGITIKILKPGGEPAESSDTLGTIKKMYDEQGMGEPPKDTGNSTEDFIKEGKNRPPCQLSPDDAALWLLDFVRHIRRLNPKAMMIQARALVEGIGIRVEKGLVKLVSEEESQLEVERERAKKWFEYMTSIDQEGVLEVHIAILGSDEKPTAGAIFSGFEAGQLGLTCEIDSSGIRFSEVGRFEVVDGGLKFLTFSLPDRCLDASAVLNISPLFLVAKGVDPDLRKVAEQEHEQNWSHRDLSDPSEEDSRDGTALEPGELDVEGLMKNLEGECSGGDEVPKSKTDDEDALEGSKFCESNLYPGAYFNRDNFFVENNEMIRVKMFPDIFGTAGEPEVNKVFRRFSDQEIKTLVTAIQETEIMPYLGFIKNALGKVFKDDLKAPFWFIPFVIYGSSPLKIGSSLYFEQNGIWSNFENPRKFDLVAHVDTITYMHTEKGICAGGGSMLDENPSWETVTTLEVETQNGLLRIFEPHGRDCGAQLEIVDALWDKWGVTVEASRGAGIFIHQSKNRVFGSFEELLEWARKS